VRRKKKLKLPFSQVEGRDKQNFCRERLSKKSLCPQKLVKCGVRGGKRSWEKITGYGVDCVSRANRFEKPGKGEDFWVRTTKRTSSRASLLRASVLAIDKS